MKIEKLKKKNSNEIGQIIYAKDIIEIPNSKKLEKNLKKIQKF